MDKWADSKTFREQYFLKEELVEFCRQNGLPVNGGKIELTERIAYYLDTGKILALSAPKKSVAAVFEIDETMPIEANFVCSEKHRAFFKEHIGKGFSFNVAFQNWLKENTGKSYKDAIDAYYRIKETKKKEKTTIDKQFEYNTYIRDFFADNKGKSLQDAIACWKYKKKCKGSHRYDKSDLIALESK